MALPTNTIVANHAFAVTEYDDGDPNHVQGAHWNANHPVTGFGVISSDCTLTVAASGADYTSVVAAYNALKNYWINPGVTVTISLADGVYNEPRLTLDHPCGQSIIITGSTPAVKTLSTIVSSSGTTADWYHVLQLNSNSGISVGDFALVEAPTGGTNPLRVAGLSKITNVGASNQVTINTKHRNTDAAGGAVASSSVKIIKAVLATTETAGNAVFTAAGCNGGRLQHLVVDGSGITDANYSVVHVGAGACLTMPGCGVWAPGNHAAAVWNSSGRFFGHGMAIAGAYSGATARYGLYTSGAAFTEASQLYVTGCNYGVASAGIARAEVWGAYSTGNVYGANAYGNGHVWVGATYSTRMTGNTTSSTYTDNADCKVSVLG